MSEFKLPDELTLDENDIWRPRQSSRPISYPLDGNQRCFQLEDSSSWFRHRNDCIIKVATLFPPSGAILDIGGGNGFVTRRFLDEGFEAVLLEPGPVGAFNAKKQRGIPHVICSTFENIRFEEGAIPAVGLFDVLEHIEDERSFIEHIYATLSPDGIMFVTVPAFPCLWSLHDVKARHYRRYTKGMLLDLLDPKFDLLYFTYFFQALTVPILLFRTLPFVLKLAKKRNLIKPEVEHGTRENIASGIMSRALRRELGKIHDRRELKWGASCLVVARKASRTVGALS